MPFCTDCERFYNPNTLDAEGNCPSGHHVEDPPERAAAIPVPWHFKVMLGLLIIYLGWRFIQLIGALV